MMLGPSELPSPDIYTRDQHTISRRDIDPDALKILYRLAQHDFKAYLVGGGVRDILLNKRPKDFDIATDATPNEIKRLFRNSRVIGRRFRLVHVFFRGGKNIEVSTFRAGNEVIEVETEPGEEEQENITLAEDNTYGTEATDAFRRDITINALFYDLSTFSVIDYVGGVRDLHNRIIRVIGNPAVRFHEDPVRMLRVIRHAARSGFRIDEECLAAILEHHSLIVRSPKMRLYEEMKKDLTCGYFLQILRLLTSCLLLPHLLPELTKDESLLLHDGSYLSACLARCDHLVLSGEQVTPTAVLSLLALFASTESSMHASTADELARAFATEEELSDALHEAFSALAVPKRERERINEVLTLWHRVSQDKVNARILRRPGITDLLLLLRFIGDEELSEELAALVGPESAARKSILPHPAHHGAAAGTQRSGGGRRHGRRRRRSRSGGAR